MQAPRERPAGYSTLAPPAADSLARRLRPLTCGRWTPELRRLLARLGVRYIAVHAGLYRLARPRCAASARRALRAHGYRPLASDGAIAIFGTAFSATSAG